MEPTEVTAAPATEASLDWPEDLWRQCPYTDAEIDEIFDAWKR
jgi:hypothetical protein